MSVREWEYASALRGVGGAAGEDRQQLGSDPAGDSETVLQHIVSLSQSVSAHAGASQLYSDLIVSWLVNIIHHTSGSGQDRAGPQL